MKGNSYFILHFNHGNFLFSCISTDEESDIDSDAEEEEIDVYVSYIKYNSLQAIKNHEVDIKNHKFGWSKKHH